MALRADMAPEDAELAGRLQSAAAYMAGLRAALKGKCGLAEVEALVGQVRVLLLRCARWCFSCGGDPCHTCASGLAGAVLVGFRVLCC